MAEKKFNLIKAIRSLFARHNTEPYRSNPQHVDPALLAFARLGLLSYYSNPL